LTANPLDDVDYMPDTYAAEVETVPTRLHLILWTSTVVLVAALVWSRFATLDEVARAEGRVIPSGQVQVVQNLEGGILAEVLTQVGDHVTEGQNLIRLDDTQFASSFNEGQLTSAALSALVARLEAEVSGTEFVLPPGFPEARMDMINQERQLYEARQRELASAIYILTQQLTQQRQGLEELRSDAAKLKRGAALTQEELEMTRPLVATGAVSRVELLRLEVAVNESNGRLDATRLAIPKAETVIIEAERKISERRQQFMSDAQTQLNEARNQLSRLTISNVALQDRVTRTEVRSPVDGTVKQVLVNTIGAVVQPGMDLIEIVPSNDSLLIEARIRPADIAFIHPGQKATVKLTAYDFSIYGGLDAVLELISADTITDDRGEHFFRIRARTERNFLGRDDNPLPIIPGMIATVNIMTGRKTVLDYLLKPLKRAQAAALSER